MLKWFEFRLLTMITINDTQAEIGENLHVFVDIDHVQQLISELTEDEIIQIKQFCGVLLENKQ